MLSNAEGLIIVLVGTGAALKGELTVGMLIAALSFKDQFSSRVSGFIDTLFDLRMLGLHMERVGDVILSEPEEDGLQRSYASVEHLAPNIRFQNVSFRYSEHEPMVIENLSFTIAAGEAVALVGRPAAVKPRW